MLPNYGSLCADYYDLDKSTAPQETLDWYLKRAKLSGGPILEPMCGSGRFLIPLAEAGLEGTGFDRSQAMIERCRRHAQERAPSLQLFEGSWDLPLKEGGYRFIFIPSGSFGLLQKTEVEAFFAAASRWLAPGGTLLFEVETLNAIGIIQPGWQGGWANRDDGSKVVLSTLSQFDPMKRVETTLCRYELWRDNQIVATEVEELQIRYYELREVDRLLDPYPLQIIGRWVAYMSDAADSTSQLVVYECQRR